MAKDDFDDLGFDDNFDMGDLDFDAVDNRKPAFKVGSGLKSGLKQELLKPAFGKNILKQMFPKGIGEGVTVADNAADTAKQVYADAKKQIAPVAKQSKSLISKMVPSDNKFVPKGVQNILSRWREEDKNSYDNSEDKNAAEIKNALEEVFADSAKIDIEHRKEDEAKDQLKQGVELRRHQDNMGALNSISNATEQTAQYITSTNAKYQKAHLQLLFRIAHFQENDRIKRDDEFKQHIELLAGISKNTALPDYVKLRGSEAITQSLRNKAVEKLAGGLFGEKSNMLNRIIKGTGKNLLNKLSGITGEISNAVSMGDMMSGMVSGMGMDPYEMAGEMAASGISGKIGSKIGKSAGKWMSPTMKEKVYGFNDKATRVMGTLNNRILDFKNGATSSDEWDTPMGRLKEFVRDLIPNSYGDTSISGNTLDDLDSPTQMTNRALIAQHTVIPGFLSRILREVSILRTGDSKIGLVDYDYVGGKFTEATAMRAKIIEEIASSSSISNSQRDIDDFITNKMNGKDLSPEARKALRQILLTNSTKGITLSEANLTSSLGAHNLNGKDDEALRALISGYASNRDSKKEVDDTNTYNRFAGNISDKRDLIQKYSDLGYRDIFTDLGIINKYGNLDLDRLINIYSGYESLDGQGTGPNLIAQGEDDKKAMASDRSNKSFGAVMAKSVKKKTAKQRRWLQNQQRAVSKKVDAKYGDNIAATKKRMQEATDDLKTKFKAKQEELSVKIDPDNLLGLRDDPDQMAPEGLRNKISAYSKQRYDQHVSSNETVKSLTKQYKDIRQAGVKGAKEAVKKKIAPITDLYKNKDPNTPWIRHLQIEAGKLYNTTSKKVVKSIDDLAGRVYDDEGNVVLDGTEASGLLAKDPNTGKYVTITKLSPVLRKGLDKLRKTKDTIIATTNSKKENITKQLKHTLDERGKQLNIAIKKANKAVHDIYDARRPSSPVITAQQLELGELTNLESGDKITDPSDIQGTVVDQTGNVVVKKEDVKYLLTFNNASKKMEEVKTRALDSKVGKTLLSLATGKTSLKDIGMGMLDSAKNKLVKFKDAPDDEDVPVDVYVDGEFEPRITAAKMVAGDYINQRTKEPVLKPSDITGPIIDTKGGFKSVLSVNEIAKAVFLNPKTGKFSALTALKKLGKGVLKFLWKWQTDWAWSLSKKILKAEWKAAKWLFSKTVAPLAKMAGNAIGGIFGKTLGGAKLGLDFRGAHYDVYRKGSSVPLLIGEYIKRGYYISDKTRKPIMSVKDIDGPIRNIKGDFVLTEDDIKSGLTDVNGRAIALKKFSVVGALFNASKNIAKMEWKALKAAGGLVNPFGKKKDDSNKEGERKEASKNRLGFDGLKRMMKSGLTSGAAKMGLSISETGSIKTVSLLEDLKKGVAKLTDKVGDSDGEGGIMGMAKTAASSLLGRGAGAAAVSAAGSIAGTAVAAEGAAAAGAAAAGIGGGLMATLGAGAAAALGVLTSPIVLGAAAVALTAYGGYKLYKYVTRDGFDPLELVRYVQYGFKADDTRHIKNIVDLESYLSEFITPINGMPQIKESKIKIDEIFAKAGIDSLTPANKKAFYDWYQNRFKHVYLTHLTACNAVFKSYELPSVHKCKKEDGIAYLNATKYPEGPYGVSTSPYPSDNLTMSTADDVAKQIQVASDYLGVDKDKGSGKSNGDSKSDASGSGSTEDLSMPIKSEDTIDSKYSTAMKSVIPPGSSMNKPDSALNRMVNAGIGKIPSSPNVNALEAIRYKAYGLKKLDLDKIANLRSLEEELSKDITFKGSDAYWQGDMRYVLSKTSQYFGIGDLESDYAIDWYVWFGNRFLPVFLKYVSGIQSYTGKFDFAYGESKLNLFQEIELGKQIMGISDAWGRKETPWPNYEVNIDPDDCIEHINYLESLKKNDNLSTNKNSEVSRDSEGNVKSKKPESFMDKVRNAFSFSKDDTSKSNGSVSGSVGSSGGSASNPTAPTSNSSSGSIAQASQQPAGTPVDYGGSSAADPNVDIPNVSGVGIKNMGPAIIAGAKKIGADPGNAMAIVGAESGFNPHAAAPKGSAKGLYQFIDSTWEGMKKIYGKKYDIAPGTHQFDVRASAILGAQLIKDSEKEVKPVKSNPNPIDLYMLHFLGPTGGRKFLRNLAANPNAPAEPDFRESAEKNPTIFFDGTRKRTYQEVYNIMSNKIIKNARAAGVEINMTGSSNGSSGGTPTITPEAKKEVPVASDPAPTVPGNTSGSKQPSTTSAQTPPSENKSNSQVMRESIKPPAAPTDAVSKTTSAPEVKATPAPAPKVPEQVTVNADMSPPKAPSASATQSAKQYTTDQPVQQGFSTVVIENYLKDTVITLKEIRDMIKDKFNAQAKQDAMAGNSTANAPTNTKDQNNLNNGDKLPKPVNYKQPEPAVSFKRTVFS